MQDDIYFYFQDVVAFDTRYTVEESILVTQGHWVTEVHTEPMGGVSVSTLFGKARKVWLLWRGLSDARRAVIRGTGVPGVGKFLRVQPRSHVGGVEFCIQLPGQSMVVPPNIAHCVITIAEAPGSLSFLLGINTSFLHK